MPSFRRAFLPIAGAGASLLLAAPAPAQTPADAMGSEHLETQMIQKVPAEYMAFNAMLSFQHPGQQARSCFKYGCLFVVNESRDYDAVALFLDTGSPDSTDAPVWSPNLLTASLEPGGARWTFKMGDRSTCAVGAKVVLRDRRTGEEVTADGEVSLCKSPRRDTAPRINVQSASVSIDEGDKG